MSVALSSCLSLLALSAVPEPPPARPDPVLEQLLAEAEAQAPELRAARAEQTAAEQQPAQAGVLPDPGVALTWINDGWSPSLGERDMSTLELMLSQSLPPRGQRGLQRQRAESETRAAATRVESARRALRAAVKRAWAGLRQARTELALAREQRELLAEVEGVARARYAVGQGGQQDVLRAQVELTRIETRLATLEAAAAQRQAELNRRAGRALEAAVPDAPELALDPVGEDDEPWLAAVTAASPELQARAVEQESAGLDVDLAKAAGRPAWGFEAGYAWRGSLDPMWRAGLSLSLPWRRGRVAAGVAEAEARRRSAAARQQAQRADLALFVRQRLLALRALERSLTVYQQGLLPQGQLSVEAALASYQAGKVPFVTVLEAQSSLYGDRRAQLELLASHATLRAGLEEIQVEAGSLPVAEAAAAAGPRAAGAAMAMGR